MFNDKYKLMVLVFLTSIMILGVLTSTPDTEPVTRYMFLLLITPVAMIAAWIGISGMRFFRSSSALGRAMLFISLGIVSWGTGNLAWFFYNILGTDVPYPSLADVGYLMMIPLANYGLYLILRSMEIKLNLKNALKIILPPVLVFILIFPLFIYGNLGSDAETLVKILNVVYPLGDVIFLSLALTILTLSYGSVLFRSLWVICAGFIIEAAADFSFSMTTMAGTYYTGCWVDALFCLAFCVIGIGMYHMYRTHQTFLMKAQSSVQKKK